jgi:hypothetical protein
MIRMRSINGWRLALLFLLLSLCWWQESSGRILNKDNESLTQKLEKRDLKPDIHQIRMKYHSQIQQPGVVYSVDEQDALLFQYIILSMLHSMQRSIRLLSTLIRVCGDTFAGVLSGVVKATGGLLSLAANVMWFVSSKLALPQSVPQFLGNLSSNCAYGLRNSANMLYGLSEACIWSGEILESVSLGLGEAVQDSFWGLETVSKSSNILVNFLLQIESTVNSTAAQLVPLSGGVTNSSVYTGELAHAAAPTAASTTAEVSGPKTESDTLQQSLREELTRHSGGILHHHQQHGGITSTSRAIEQKLGKQWVAPVDTAAGTDTSTGIKTEVDEGAERGPSSTGHGSSMHHQPLHEGHTASTPTHSVGVGWGLGSFLTGVHGAWAEEPFGRPGKDKHSDAPERLPVGWEDWQAWVKDTAEAAVSLLHYAVFELPAHIGKESVIAWENVNIYGDAAIVYGSHVLTHVAQSMATLNWATVLEAITTATAGPATAEDTASQGLFLLTALSATFVISTLPFRALRWKVATVAVFAAVVYVSFTATESVQRGRIAERAKVEATHTLLQQQTAQRDRRQRRSQESAILGHPTTPTAQAGAEKEDFEFDDATWLNGALSSMWEVLDPQLGTGGLGPYISEVYADMVSTELGKVPPGVANVKLKRFELGHSAPLLKGIRVLRVRNESCMDRALEGQLHPSATAQSAGSGARAGEYNLLRQDGLLAHVLDYVQHSEVLRTHPFLKALYPQKTTGSSAPAPKGVHRTGVATNQSKLPFLDQFSAQCDRLVVEVDAVYASRDMGVALSLRSNDLKTLVPEVTVTLSEVHVAGQLRLNISLTSEYPFLGEGQVGSVGVVAFLCAVFQCEVRTNHCCTGCILQLSFLRPPQLAFSISSFGGLELTSMPYAFQWVNSSMHWLLAQVGTAIIL